jgi:biotin carboxylase
MKKTIAAVIAAALVVLCPGLGSYAAAGEVMSARTGAPMSGPMALPAASPLGALQAAPGLQVRNLSLDTGVSAAAARSAAAVPGASAAGAASVPALPASAAAPAAAAVQPAARMAGPEGAKAKDARANGPETARDGPAVNAIGQAQRAAEDAAAPTAAAAAAPSPDGPGPNAGRAFDGSAPGGKALLLVGTSASRPFIVTEAKRVADELGYTLYLLDKPSARDGSKGVIADEHFIPAAIDNHDEKNAQGIVDQIAEFSKRRGIEAVVTFLNPYAHLAGDIVDRIGAKGLSGRGIEIAHTKSLAREAMASVPEIATPARVVKTAEEARRFFKEQGGGKIVMKPIKGGGSQGVITDIETEEQAVASFNRLDAELIEFMKRPDAGFFNLDQHPGIMVERQLEGPEVDVELIVQNGVVKFSHVSDNAPMDRPNAVEKNSTYSSVLPADIQKQLVDGAEKAARVMGLTDGNLHIEMMMTPEGPRVLEVNARMGGAFVWEFIKDQTGISLVEQGIRAVLGLSVDAGKTPDSTLEARFMIPSATGVIESIEGLDALEAMPGFIRAKMLHKAGDQVKAAPDDAFDYIGYIGVRGKDYDEAMERTLKALESVKIRIRKADGTVVEQTAAYTHSKVDTLGLLTPKAQEPQKKEGALATIKSLPKSFLFGFTPGWTVNAVGAEIQAVALPLFTAALFDVPMALMITGIGYVLRVVGAWVGSSLMTRFNPVKVNNAALLLVAAAGASLAVAGMVGAGSGVILGLLIANSVIGGLAYGVTRGVAENLLPRMILGKEGAPKLETALNYAYQWVELGSIVAALFVAVPLLKLVGGPWMMAISSAMIGGATIFYSGIKFAEQWKKTPKAEASGASAAPAAKADAKSDLSLKDYAPVVFFRFMHFMMYGVLSTVLALSVFKDGGAAGTTIGVYDGGSWAFSLLAAMSLLPKSMGRRSATVLGAAAAVAFLWSAVAFPFLPVTAAIGGLLGGLITVNTNKWMPYYNKHMSADKYREFGKWLMTASVAGLLPVFAAVSAIRVFPAVAAVLSMPALLTGIAVAITALALLLVYWQATDKKP